MLGGRRSRCAVAGVLATAIAAIHVSTSAAAPSSRGDRCQISVSRNVSVPMRDGTILKADVYRPRTSEKVPVILQRLPYDKAVAEYSPVQYKRPEFFASHCYIVVNQDVRGQYQSRGVWYPFAHEMQDGYDSVEWAAKLPGSNGRVGMYGISYVGATQWLAATQAPPHLKTIVPGNTGSDYYEGWTYQDGALSQAFAESWPLTSIARSAAADRGDWALVDEIERNTSLLPSKWYGFLPLDQFPPLHPGDPKVAPYFFDWLAHPTDDAYWRQWSIKRRYDQIKVPVLSWEGWYDSFLTGNLENFKGMRRSGGSAVARANQQIVIGPWVHLNWSRYQPDVENPVMDYGPRANNPINTLQLRWWDHWLKGVDNGVTKRAPVRLFVMGANRWLDARDWPVPGTRYRNYYLDSDGHANSTSGDGTLSRDITDGTPDHFRYDPANPVPSKGGHSCCGPPLTPMGPADQRSVERRDDVLVYSTPRLRRSLPVVGPITVTLHAASSAPDTDFTAKLVDVHPDGRAIILNDGIIRASYRESTTSPTLIQPGKVYEYKINVWPTANLFKRGHRVRLEISSSNFPAYDRNLNTGARLGTTSEMRVAEQTILHDRAHPSRLTLPILPDRLLG
jgi:putative CocE/NonD family hydrolase